MVASYTGQWTWSSQALTAVVLSEPVGVSQHMVNPGEFRSDSRDWANATVLDLSYQDLAQQDAFRLFSVMASGDTIHIAQANNTTNWSDYTLTGAPTEDEGSLSWSLPVSRTGGTGQASNGQTTTFVFTVGSTTLARVCEEHDIAGYVAHKMPLPIIVSGLALGLAWCQYCHEVFVMSEPQPPHTNLG